MASIAIWASYNICYSYFANMLYENEIKCVLSRFLKVDSVDVVWLWERMVQPKKRTDRSSNFKNLYGDERRSKRVDGGVRCGTGGDQRAPQTSPPWSRRRENEQPLCVRLAAAVGSCPAQPPTGPNRAAAGLLIWPTITAGARTHSILRSARQQHGLLLLYAMYIVCQKHRAQTGAGPKKELNWF